MSKGGQNIVRFNVLQRRMRELYDIATRCAATKERAGDGLLEEQFLVRYRDIDRHRENMDNVFAVLMSETSLDDKERSNLERNYNEFQEQYYSIQVMHSNIKPQQYSASTIPERKVSHDFHLPKISLSRFSGVCVEWPNFISIFNSLIHNNANLSEVEKIHYLLSVLDKEPLSLVKHLSITAENYIVAYKLLNDRYQNKRIIADKHIDAILNLPNLTQVNVKSLSKFVFTIKENTQALIAIDFNVNSWCFLLLHIILKKLPTDMRSKFESTIFMNSIPTFDQLMVFLENQLRVLENISSSTHKSTPSNSFNVVDSNNKSQTKSDYSLCPCCSENHLIYKCLKFDKMNPMDRKNFITQHKLCYNCLRSHHVSKCLSRSVCQICHGRHHTKLHLGNNQPATTHPVSVQAVDAPVQGQSLHSIDGTSTMVLGTALVRVQDVDGHYHTARALIGGGSQVCMVTECLEQRLRLPRTKSGALYGLGMSVSQSTNGVVHSSIKSVHGTNNILTSDFIILKSITSNLPSVTIHKSVLNKCNNLKLADKYFFTPGRIDLLLGVGLYDQFFDGGKYNLGENMPTAYSSVFGWVIMGSAPSAAAHVANIVTMTCTMQLSEALSRFWEVEEPPKRLIQDPEDIQCEKHFSDTHSRDITGRFTVQLPFKVNHKPLGDTYFSATKRFFHLERRLLRDDRLRLLYTAFMRDYLEAGHMREVVTPVSSDRYYIPHHGVLKEQSSTTKLRAVFDASAPSSNGVSLNQVLMSGPKLQKNIEDIILRLRLHKIVFTGDIRQMYRQINVSQEDCKYQTILWRESPNLPLKQYELTTVTYGVSSSAFQAIRVIHELAQLNSERYPDAAKVLLEDTFVDDVIGGSSCVESALQLQRDLVAILTQGGFLLRKWSSNSDEFLSSCPIDHCESPYRFEDGDNVYKVLGLEWNSRADNFLYHVSEMGSVMTKRGVLSNIAKLYDPCGFLAPTIFQAKLFMQKLWLLDAGWDDPLPYTFAKEWHHFLSDFPNLNHISIQRRILPDQPVDIQLHGFSDASEQGYSACAYLRVESSDGSVLVQLLAAKSRVAPLKQKLTIPKLELNGAFLLARLMEHTFNVLQGKLNINSSFAWTDSSIVLSWLSISPHKLNIYEGNRVSQIQMLLPNVSWKHVPTSANPADCASRGISPSDLVNHSLWWSPSWLASEESSWPGKIPLLSELDLPSIKPLPLAAVAQASAAPFCFDSFSTFTRLHRVIAWSKRFITNSRNSKQRRTGPLSVSELSDSLTSIVKLVQSTAFTDTLELLRAGKRLKGSLLRLNPFIDQAGLLRVGGRLVKSGLSYAAKHPMLLPKDHFVTYLIIEHYHRLHLHPGLGTMQALLHRKFWVVSARRAIKHVIFKCHRCYRLRPKTIEPFMGNLPSSRVTSCRPFQRVGVDFAGPFWLRQSKLRNAKALKAYMCLFVCFSTKCVHLEIVSELSTEAFIACLDRFVSRRGFPTDIYSDCGTNFVGARNYLMETSKLLQASTNSIHQHLINYQVNWHLNPPASPHMGGLWESAIRSAKLILSRVIGERILLFEELATIFAKVESVVNSRPLCPVTSDPSDLDVLTPGHFLIGQPLLSLPEEDIADIAISPLKRWQLTRQITQHFWKRWHSEYLHTLMQRPKWLAKESNIRVGDLVLIKDTSPPLKWRKARVVRLCPGTDGVVRVVELKTATGTLLRPVVKLCPLVSD